MWLPWEYAAVGAVVCVAASFVRGLSTPWRTLLREVAVVALLYALWLRAGQFDPFGAEGGLERGRQVYDIQRSLHFLDEATLQRWVLPHGWLVQFSNIYYAGLHVPAMGALLLWLWFRHRDRYWAVRTTLAVATGAGLAIRFVPVAPPRFYPELGFVDTGLLYGQSVYGRAGTGVSGQMAAMPSIHVSWAVLVGVVVWFVGARGWRWLGPAHAALTMFVVTDTANHWWLDSLAGAALLAPAWWLATRGHRILSRQNKVSLRGAGSEH